MEAATTWPQRLDARDIGHIVRHAFGADARTIRIELLAGGQTNDTRMLTLDDGRRFVLRVAPTVAMANAGPGWFTPYGLRREAAVIAAAADLRRFLPVTVASDFEHALIDRDWVLQEVVPGRSLSALAGTLTDAEQATLWREAGAFTRRLHAVTGAYFGPPAWGPRYDRWSSMLAAETEGFVNDAGQFGLPVATFARLCALVDRLAPLLDEGTVPRLIHSDLWAWHLFAQADAEGVRLSGVIDLEFGHFADCLSEHLLLTFGWGSVPVAMRPALLAGYGARPVPVGMETRAAVYRALGLGWEITLRAFKGVPGEDLMRDLAATVEALDRA